MKMNITKAELRAGVENQADTQKAYEKSARSEATRGLLSGRIKARFRRSFSVKTGLRSSSLVPTLLATAMLLSIGSVGCVVAATGADTTDEKSQTQELDTTDTTAQTATNGDIPKTPDHDAVKAGGQGGGPDPSPWRETTEATNGGPNGPDPSPWDVNSTTTSSTRK
jgi:hypothetical protein